MIHRPDAAVTYGSYLKLEELLSLQQPRSEGPEHDEMLFIVIHQTYELWFKELLHEFDYLRRLLEADESHRAQHTLKRMLTILKVLVAQLDILETMTPLEFLSFRKRLESASGFQSDQFRELEFLLGKKSAPAIRAVSGRQRRAGVARAPLPASRRYGTGSRFLARGGHAVPQSPLDARRRAPRRVRRRRCSES